MYFPRLLAASWYSQKDRFIHVLSAIAHQYSSVSPLCFTFRISRDLSSRVPILSFLVEPLVDF